MIEVGVNKLAKGTYSQVVRKWRIEKCKRMISIESDKEICIVSNKSKNSVRCMEYKSHERN